MTKPIDKQLIEFSGEHLYYEIKMLFEAANLLTAMPASNQYVFCALLESFVLHTYNMLDFFYKPQIKPDDAKAYHYIKDFDGWKKALPAYESYFRLFNRRRNREVTHLSYKRMEVTGDTKSWHVQETTQKMKTIVGIFMKFADGKLLHPKLNEFKCHP